MARPTSFRLPEDLLERLDKEAAARALSVTALVSRFLDEGLKTSRFSGIVYRDGPTGRRAGLVGGPDVWEVIRAFKQARGKEERRVQVLADELSLPAERIRLAIDFYALFSEEIEARIAADERAAGQTRGLVDGRRRLLAM